MSTDPLTDLACTDTPAELADPVAAGRAWLAAAQAAGGTYPARTSVSEAASFVARRAQAHAEAALHDAGFDAGEFSEGAHVRALAREVREGLAKQGWTAPDLYDAVKVRTSERWLHFSGLGSVLDLAGAPDEVLA